MRFLSAPVSGRSSGVEHNLAKVGVEGSNPFARSTGSIQADRHFLASGEREDRGKSAGNLDIYPALRFTGCDYDLIDQAADDPSGM